MKELKVETKERGATRVILISARLFEGGQPFTEVIAAAANDGKNVVLDCSDIQWINSIGIGELVGAFNRLRNRGLSVAFANVPPKIENVFKVIKLSHVFASYESADAAVAAIESEARPPS